MVILNKNEKPYELELARFANMLEGTTHGLDVISGITFPMSGKIALPTKGALILDLK
jgi:hypothetical protein